MTNNLNKVITTFKEKSTEHDPNLTVNFIHVSDELKVQCLDNIMDITKDVYGPYGGLYANYARSVQTGEANAIKSKDGNNFFTKLEVYPAYANSILTLVRQQSDYIAGYGDSTSKDGTTSMAIVASAISKMMLTRRSNGEFRVPSTINNAFFNFAVEEGTALIDKYKHDTYNDSTNEFEHNGKEIILDAVNTTVNGSPLFKEAFSDLMNKCEESKINMLDMFIETPITRSGLPKLQFEVLNGISIICSDIIKNNTKAFKEDGHLVFLIDGFADINFVSSIYLRLLYNFLYKTLFQIADALGGVNGVLLIFTRTPENVLSVIKPINEAGVLKAKVKTGTVTKSLKFRAMAFDDTLSGRERFEDLRNIFKESIIDVSFLDTATKELLGKHYLNDKDSDAVNADRIANEFGTNISLDTFIDLNNNYAPLKDIFGTWKDGQLCKLDCNGDLTTKAIDLRKCLVDVKYDGYNVSLMFRDEEISNRAVAIKKELDEIKKSVVSNSTNTDDLEYRIRCLNSARIQPIVYTRSEDEWSEIKTLLEDALGVFISTISNGVMAGGNVFFLKHIEEFKSNVMKRFEDEIVDKISVAKCKVYREALESMIESIYEGYIIAYKLLTREDDNDEFIKLIDWYRKHAQNKELSLASMNIVTGFETDCILEAARTTADVFSCALSIAKDMVTIDRFNLQSLNDFSSFNVFKNAKPYHKINDKFIEQK